MRNVHVSFQGDATTAQDARPMAQQIREQVREQVRAAQEQARTAAEQARAARLQGELARLPAQVGETQVLVPPPFPQQDIPHGAITISVAFFITLAVMVIGLPIARAWARRMDRRAAATQTPPELASQLQRIEQAVEAVAIEVERISEAQRFQAKLMAERTGDGAALPAGKASIG